MRTRLVSGRGAVGQLGQLAAELGAKKVLLVTDPGIQAAGHYDRACESLRQVKLQVHTFTDVGENPTTEHVERGAVVARACRPDLIVGLGGGSSLDCAKGINFLHTNGGRMQDYWGVGLAKHPMLPMIAVPTTGGTGSEMQSFALISDAETHQKMACGDKKASFAIALLDPELTITQPPRVTAVTGMDAISHAVESYVCNRRNPISTIFSREAWRLLATNYLRVIQNPTDLDARESMQLGAAYAGLAIENSMLGAAHSLANPITARFGTVHGQAVGIALPHVVRFNAANGMSSDDSLDRNASSSNRSSASSQPHAASPDLGNVERRYRELLLVTQDSHVTPNVESGSQGIAEFLTKSLIGAGLETRWRDCGVDQATLPELAEQAARQWTAKFNPRSLQIADFINLYEQSW